MTAWFPLREAALCLNDDCGVIFRYAPYCPACGGREHRMLAVWLDRKRRAA